MDRTQKNSPSSSPVKSRFGRQIKSPQAGIKKTKSGRSGSPLPKIFNRLAKSSRARQAETEWSGNTMTLDDCFTYFKRIMSELTKNPIIGETSIACANEILGNIASIEKAIVQRRKNSSDQELGQLSSNLCDELNLLRTTYQSLKAEDCLPGDAYKVSYQAIQKLLDLASTMTADAVENFTPVTAKTPLQKPARRLLRPVSTVPSVVARTTRSSSDPAQSGMPDRKAVQFSVANETRLYIPGSISFSNREEKSGDNADSACSEFDPDDVTVTVADAGDSLHESAVLTPYERNASVDNSLAAAVTASITTSVTSSTSAAFAISVTTSVTTSATSLTPASDTTSVSSPIRGDARNRAVNTEAAVPAGSPGGKRRAQEELHRSSPKLPKSFGTQSPAKSGLSQIATEADVDDAITSDSGSSGSDAGSNDDSGHDGNQESNYNGGSQRNRDEKS